MRPAWQTTISPSTFFFSNATATSEIYPLSLHDALPILHEPLGERPYPHGCRGRQRRLHPRSGEIQDQITRSEEHTSELQSRRDLVCRLLLEKKKPFRILPQMRQLFCRVAMFGMVLPAPV